MTTKKKKEVKIDPKKEFIDKIVEQAKLMAVGKVRNTYELELAARKLIELEK